jgi:integrase
MKVLREGPIKLTRANVDAAWRRRASGQRLVLSDATCRGLALVVNATSMAWSYSYKPRGVDAGTSRRFASRSVTIGNPQTHSPEAARDAANVLKGQAKAGGDPAADRKAKIAAAADRRGCTMDRLAADYIQAVPTRSKLRGGGRISVKHASEEISNVKAAVVAMRAGGKPVFDVDAADLRLLLRADSEHPNAARHRFGAISRFFDWCQDEGVLKVNPCSMIAKARRPKAPASRSEYLEPNDLARLWNVVGDSEGLADVHRDLIRFLIAIPCRRGEATSMDWQHVDLEAGIWSQPGRLTKNRDSHRLHLHPLALDIVQSRHEAAGKPKRGWVFPAPRSGKAIDTFTKIKAALAKAAPDLIGWWFHDMRRSFASTLGEAGIPEAVADAVLNHRQSATRGGVLGVYQRASRWPEQVRAMTLWGQLLTAALQESDAGAKVCRPGGLNVATASPESIIAV